MVRRMLGQVAALSLSLIATGPALAAASGATAGLDAPTIAVIDALVARQVHADGPGCLVQVARGAEVVWARGYGLASLAYGVRITPETVFPIASNSKEFTAMAILLLAEEGKLALDDEARKYLPELPDYGRPLRLRHLLFHTSGLRDYHALRFLAGVPPERLERAEVMGLLTRQKALNFPPGTAYAYSNAGYVVLGSIAERVSGKPLPQLAAERIFAPLGMTHTLWTERGDLVVPRGATLYMGNRDTGYRTTTTASLAGSGGIWTTAGDLQRWIANLRHNRLGRNPTALGAQELTRGALDDGQPIDYGFGLFHGEHRGRRIVWHSGSTAADFVWFPQEDVAVVCLCNGRIDSQGISRQVADAVLGLRAPKAAAAPAAKAGPKAAEEATAATAPVTLARFAGSYRNPKSGTVFRFAVENGKLTLTAGTLPITLRPTAADEVVSVEPDLGWRLRFEPPGQAPAVVRLYEEGAETAHYDRLPEAPAPAALAGYAGTFWSDELRARYVIAAEGNDLVLHTPVQPNGSLLYLGDDHFVLPSPWFDVELQFGRGRENSVDRLTVSTGEANGLAFSRLPDCAAEPAARP